MSNQISPTDLYPGDTVWVEHTVKNVINNSVSTNGGTFKISKIKKHIPLDRTFKVGDQVEIIGECQSEVYTIALFTTDRQQAVLSWFGDYFGIFPINVLKKVKE